jgi:predicted transposase/invertase (TIGR01784 family)
MSSLKTSFKEGLVEGEKVGIERGKIEGKIEEKIEIALAMKAEGFTTAQIAKITGLSKDEIARL